MAGVTLFLDIETLPAEDKDAWLADHGESVRPRRGESDEDARERAFRETSLDGTFGRLFCIGYVTEPPADSPVGVISGDEATVLRQFWTLARKSDLFIGHNVLDFDLRFIYQRSVILDVKPTKQLSFARYRSAPVFDTMREWSKWGQGQYTSLDVLATALGIESPKAHMSGADVYDYWRADRGSEILEYCRGDVEVLRRVYRRMTFSNAV
jgi:DNA polymerase elongation subunit (family B)